MSVDLPTPLGPSTATNSPWPTASLPGGGCQRALEGLELAGLPVLEGRTLRRQRLRHRPNRDALCLGRVDEPLDVGRRVLTVEDQHLDGLRRDLLVHGRLVG